MIYARLALVSPVTAETAPPFPSQRFVTALAGWRLAGRLSVLEGPGDEESFDSVQISFRGMCFRSNAKTYSQPNQVSFALGLGRAPI
jgi:hypothetical protein